MNKKEYQEQLKKLYKESMIHRIQNWINNPRKRKWKIKLKEK